MTQIALSWLFKKNITQKRKIKFIELNIKSHSLDYFIKHLDNFTGSQKLIIQSLIKKHPNSIALTDFKNIIPSIYSAYKKLIKNNFLIETLTTSDSINSNISIQSIEKIQLTNIQSNIYSQLNDSTKPHFIPFFNPYYILILQLSDSNDIVYSVISLCCSCYSRQQFI